MVRNIIPFDPKGRDRPADPEAEALVDAMSRSEMSGGDASATPDQAELEALWDAMGLLDTEDFADAASTPAGFWSRRHVMAGVGAIAATLVVGVAAYLMQPPQVYESQRGEQRVVALSDGSHVTLNTQSRIEVRIRLGQRRVVLRQGEALFEVAHLSNNAPFFVEADKASIRVTGTKFNVRRYANHTGIDLLEGHIQVSPVDAPGQLVKLSAGQGMDVGLDGHFGVPRTADSQSIDDWTHNRLTFDNERLANAVARINRYSAIQLKIESPSLNNMRINGVFEAGDAQGFAEALHGLYKVKFSRDANTIDLEAAE